MAIEEFLKMTQNILHMQHYLCLIAKRYLIQLYKNEDEAYRDSMSIPEALQESITARETKKVCLMSLNIVGFQFL